MGLNASSCWVLVVESNGDGFVFIGGFVFVVNESLEIFCVSDLAGK